MQHALDLRPLLEPTCQRERLLLLMAHTHARRAQSAECEIDVIGCGVIAELGRGLPDFREARLRADRKSHHHVGVPDDVLGASDDGNVDPKLDRLIEERRSPGVVEHGRDAPRLRHRDDRRHVLHLEGDGTRALQINYFGVVAHQRRDAGADHGIIEGRLDAEPFEKTAAEGAYGSIDRIDHEQVIAGLQKTEQCRVTGRSAGAVGDRAVPAFERRHRILECESRGCAIAAIADDAFLEPALLAFLQMRHRRMQNGRGMIDGRIHHPEVHVRIAPRVGEKRVRLFGIGCHNDPSAEGRDPHLAVHASRRKARRIGLRPTGAGIAVRSGGVIAFGKFQRRHGIDRRRY